MASLPQDSDPDSTEVDLDLFSCQSLVCLLPSSPEVLAGEEDTSAYDLDGAEVEDSAQDNGVACPFLPCEAEVGKGHVHDADKAFQDISRLILGEASAEDMEVDVMVN